jgi:hypothetical protein
MSSQYSAEERRRIIAEARATLERLNDQDRRQDLLDLSAQRGDGLPIAPDPLARMQNAGGQLPLLPSTAMNKWREEAAEQEERLRRAQVERAEQERRIMDERKAQSDAGLNAWVGAKIAAALDGYGFNDVQTSALGQIIGEIRQRIRDEITEQVGGLRAEFNMRQSAERQDRKSEVLDLPREFWKRRDVA